MNKRLQAQSSIEASLALVLAVLFLVLSCNLFVWLNHNIVQRQKEYEKTRTIAATSPDVRLYPPGTPHAPIPSLLVPGEPGKPDFYETGGSKKNVNYRPLSVFSLGGYKQ